MSALGCVCTVTDHPTTARQRRPPESIGPVHRHQVVDIGVGVLLHPDEHIAEHTDSLFAIPERWDDGAGGKPSHGHSVPFELANPWHPASGSPYSERTWLAPVDPPACGKLRKQSERSAASDDRAR